MGNTLSSFLEIAKTGADAAPLMFCAEASAEERTRNEDGEKQHSDRHRKQDLIVGGLFRLGFDLVHLFAPVTCEDSALAQNVRRTGQKPKHCHRFTVHFYNSR